MPSDLVLWQVRPYTTSYDFEQDFDNIYTEECIERGDEPNLEIFGFVS
jgi:hypothetical protein